jgi:valyl-tRNA synthetase
VLSARPAAGAGAPHPLVARLARLEVDGAGAVDAIASVASLEILPSEGLEAAAVEERMAERRRKLESEVARAEGKLSNRGFVDNAPPEVVESEREKLERYRDELAELGG